MARYRSVFESEPGRRRRRWLLAVVPVALFATFLILELVTRRDHWVVASCVLAAGLLVNLLAGFEGFVHRYDEGRWAHLRKLDGEPNRRGRHARSPGE